MLADEEIKGKMRDEEYMSIVRESYLTKVDENISYLVGLVANQQAKITQLEANLKETQASASGEVDYLVSLLQDQVAKKRTAEL